MIDQIRVATLAVLFGVTASCVVQVPPPVTVAGPPASGALEYGMNRMGSDYRNVDVPSGRPEDCREVCLSDASCAAFTFVKPGVQGPSARCWLKNPAPPATPDENCVSGIGAAGSAPAPVVGIGPLEFNTNRMGGDYRNFDLPSANPELCRDACASDPRCLAFTYVNPGVQGPRPRCWLKNPSPNPSPVTNCVSGAK